MSSGLVYFRSRTFYHRAFEYEEPADGGLTYSIANNHLTWDLAHRLQNTSAKAGGWMIEIYTLK